MLNIANLKKRPREDSTKDSASKRFQSMALLRITKDINDLCLPSTCELDFPDHDDLFHFQLTIEPKEGFYKRFKTVFAIDVGPNYPFEPPKVKCLTEIYHPNIDCDGNVCLNILRRDWKPVLSINSVIYGLLHLLLEPNPEDPLNKVAAEEMKFDEHNFASHVRKVAKGLMSVRNFSEDHGCPSDSDG